MGLIPQDALQRRDAAQEKTTKHPNDPTAWIALSNACQTLVDEEGAIAAARRAVELAPDDNDGLRRLASCLVQTGPGLSEARSLFEKLIAADPADAVALHYLYIFSIQEGDYRRAIDVISELDRLHPGDPVTAGRIARAHKLAGDSQSAVRYYALAAQRCDNAQLPFPYSPNSSLKPAFARLAGDNALSERLSHELCRGSGRGLADLAQPRYPKDCIESLARLQERVAGRDLFLFGFGPSLAQIADNKTAIAEWDFASMTLSAFQVVEDSILRPLQRRIDLVCMTHPSMMRRQEPGLREWMSAVPRGVLVAQLWLRELASITGAPDFLLGDRENIFWFDCFHEQLPPSPGNPLHIPAVNTLMCALGVALLAKPRRIFLFGFDGQVKGTDIDRPGALYFRDGDKNYHAQHRTNDAEARRLTKSWLWWDSLHFNEFAPVVLRHLALLFDLPQPPIYNVCVDSALDPFPRITFDRFHEILTSVPGKTP